MLKRLLPLVLLMFVAACATPEGNTSSVQPCCQKVSCKDKNCVKCKDGKCEKCKECAKKDGKDAKKCHKCKKCKKDKPCAKCKKAAEEKAAAEAAKDDVVYEYPGAK